MKEVDYTVGGRSKLDSGEGQLNRHAREALALLGKIEADYGIEGVDVEQHVADYAVGEGAATAGSETVKIVHGDELNRAFNYLIAHDYLSEPDEDGKRHITQEGETWIRSHDTDSQDLE